jgi:hypothetical protein
VEELNYPKEFVMKNAKLLTVVIVLQAMILAGQWLGAPSVVAPAQAQIPDAGGQRLEIISLLKGMNDKMDRLIGILDSGKLEVHVAGADDNKAAPKR